MTSLSIWLRIIGLIILFVFRIFLAAAELSLSAVNRIRIMQQADEGVKKAQLLLDLLNRPNQFLSALLFLTLLADTGAAAIATTLAVRFLPFGAAIATGLVTLMLFIYAEMIPKTFALNNPERVALGVIRPVAWLTRAIYPLTYIFIQVANLFIRLLGGKITREGPFLTEEEIKTMVTVGEEAGVIEEEEKEMIHSIFEFGDTVVREVMVPRVDIVAVESKDSLEEVLDVIIKEGHSRIPVYEESIDNIIGIVYARDLLIQLNKIKQSKIKANSQLKKLLRPAYYIPESKRVSELLKELQRKKIHMAIVLDEYGGTAGLVTIEDLLEEIVGEIFDEYDLEEAMVEPIGEDSYRLDARAYLDEVGEMLGVEFPEEVGDTIGGLVYNLVGHIPATGDKVKFRNLEFTVEKVVGRRILKIVVTRTEPEEEIEESM